MRPYSFYYLATGLFTGSIRTTGRRKEDIPVPDGCGIAEGAYDHLSQRVDLSTGLVTDYQPAPPDTDHEWIEQDADGAPVRRWTLKPAVAERRHRRQQAQTEMKSLETLQVRSISDLLADPNDREARANFDRRKARIDELRPTIVDETERSER